MCFFGERRQIQQHGRLSRLDIFHSCCADCNASGCLGTYPVGVWIPGFMGTLGERFVNTGHAGRLSLSADLELDKFPTEWGDVCRSIVEYLTAPAHVPDTLVDRDANLHCVFRGSGSPWSPSQPNDESLLAIKNILDNQQVQSK